MQGETKGEEGKEVKKRYRRELYVMGTEEELERGKQERL